MKWIKRGTYDKVNDTISSAEWDDIFITIDPATGVNYLHYGNTIIPRLTASGKLFVSAVTPENSEEYPLIDSEPYITEGFES